MGCVTVDLQRAAEEVPDVRHRRLAHLRARCTPTSSRPTAITGPWRLVTYMKDFGEQAYFVNFPSKFISPDGRTLWLCYSANFAKDWNKMKIESQPPGSRYGLVLQKVRLLRPGER